MSFRNLSPVRTFLFLCLAASTTAAAASHGVSIEIDLTAQKAWLLQDGQRVYETRICSGRAGYPTPTGDFVITEKDREHRSSLYGRIVGPDGRTIVADADSDMARSPGSRFVAAPMKFFLRFDGATGMHAGSLPGYPASHGCVRLPPGRAALFFNVVEVGTPVRVFGRAPYVTLKKRLPAKSEETRIRSTRKRSWFPWLRRIAPTERERREH